MCKFEALQEESDPKIDNPFQVEFFSSAMTFVDIMPLTSVNISLDFRGIERSYDAG